MRQLRFVLSHVAELSAGSEQMLHEAAIDHLAAIHKFVTETKIEPPDMQAAVEALSNVANHGASGKEFVESMANEHRTLQQAMTGLMLAWFKHLAALPEGHYDLRNEASVRIAKKIMTAVDGATHLPCI
jgi:hypothetical protein